MQIATAAQMQTMDKATIEDIGIPSTLLMERAASGYAEAALKFCQNSRNNRVLAFCGPGNNGGDGVAAARMLRKAGLEVRILLVGKREKMTEDCREMERRLMEAGGNLEGFQADSLEQEQWCKEADVILDALFGVGLNKEIQGDAAAAIRWMNESRGTVISADIASGVEADTGRILGCAVKADVTVTFTYAKVGHMVGKGALHTGELLIHDIGIPKEVKASYVNAQAGCVCCLKREEVAKSLPVRPLDGHKGTFGKVYVLGGSTGYTGAPVFAAKAAVRTGSGLVFSGVPKQIYNIVAVKSDEAMPYPLPCDEAGRLNAEAFLWSAERLTQCDAGLLGPGMGRSADVEKLVCKLAYRSDKPLVIDADGLYAIRSSKQILKERAKRGLVTILTPHDGEFAYLGGELGEPSSQDRLGAAKAFAKEYGCILVLKGHRTIVAAPDGRMYVNTTGNHGLAKGGSGDVLAGMIVSFLGQGMEPALACAVAVWMHGRAGDLCAEALTPYAMRPMDVVEYLPLVFKELEKEAK